ncbi:unnamed protein product [Phaeothamnion confervicola]
MRVTARSALGVACVVFEVAASSMPNRWTGTATRAVSSESRWTSRLSHALAVRGGSDAPVAEPPSKEEELPLPQDELDAKSLKALLGDTLLSSDGEVSAAEALAGKTVAIFFCSKQVTEALAGAKGQQVLQPLPVLKDVYAKAKAAGHPLEVVYVPVAEDAEAFESHFGEMPWLAVMPSNATTANLVRKAGVNMLPAVVVVDEKSEVVTTDGYSNMVRKKREWRRREGNVWVFDWTCNGFQSLGGEGFCFAKSSACTSHCCAIFHLAPIAWAIAASLTSIFPMWWRPFSSSVFQVYFPDDFPWHNKDVRALIGDSLVSPDGTTVAAANALTGKVIALYFSASWCEPCKTFTPQLKELYATLAAAGKPFEVIFVSSDKSEEEFKAYHADMPWLALPFNGRRKAVVAALLNVRALPTLLVYDEESRLITAQGRVEVVKDPTGESFPWHPKPIAPLDDSPELLAQRPAVVLFMEGADAKQQEKLLAALKPVAEARQPAAGSGGASPVVGGAAVGGGRAVAFLSAGEVTQLSGAMRKLCGLEEIQGKFKFMKSKKHLLQPRAALLDLLENRFFVDDAPLSEEGVSALLARFEAGELEMKQFEIPEKPDVGEGADGGDDGDGGMGGMNGPAEDDDDDQ